jgi:hypothetical protein
MKQKEVQTVVIESIERANQARDEDAQLSADLGAPLFGAGSILDSLGLVALLFDIEDGLRDLGWDGSLSDERAMSMERSPFRTVSSLVDYILTTAETA